MPTALLSVFDKTGIVELAQVLADAGWDIISSGGTAKAIQESGVAVTDVADLTGFPALLGHRVVTLHPMVHGGILADLDDPAHISDLEQYNIAPIALVVVNLYPFADNPSIELIDIGGPTLVRAAAKNHGHVAVVVRPSDYGRVIDDIKTTNAIGASTRRELAAVAFTEIAHYDIAIAQWMAHDKALPEHLFVASARVQELRYGENPHQSGARYRFDGQRSWWDSAVQHGGKELSYLNVYDTEAAWRLVNQFSEVGCVIVKHANPCGVAISAHGSIAEAYSLANACDPVSAFGGIVAVNRTVTKAMAESLAQVFTEVVVAPSFDADALEVLLTKKNLRVISATAPAPRLLDIRSIDGGFLVQNADTVNLDRSTWKVVTDTQPTTAQWLDLEFAWQVCAVVSSNAIVFAKNRQAFGIGAGQQNRLDSARIAAERSAGRAVDGVCASDAFFPFRDGLDATAAAGITAVIQPGGSVRDDEVIAAANEHGIAMVFTSERHFKH